MNAAIPDTARSSHSVAAEINRALSSSGLTISELAQKAVLSEAFIRSVLVGEDGLGRLVNLDFMQLVADTTGRTLTIKIPPNRESSRAKTVETERT